LVTVGFPGDQMIKKFTDNTLACAIFVS